MGTVIWVNYLKAGQVTSDQSDKWAIYRFTDKLDRICSGIGIRNLSDFQDTTDAEANLAEDIGTQEGAIDTYALMAEKGKWFEPDEGLAVIDRLLTELRERPVRFGLLGDKYSMVVAELEECRQSVQKAEDDGALFHLSVVT